MTENYETQEFDCFVAIIIKNINNKLYWLVCLRPLTPADHSSCGDFAQDEVSMENR